MKERCCVDLSCSYEIIEGKLYFINLNMFRPQMLNRMHLKAYFIKIIREH
mgnify:CR=1 FL=1